MRKGTYEMDGERPSGRGDRSRTEGEAEAISLYDLQEGRHNNDEYSPGENGGVEQSRASNRINSPINPGELPLRDAIYPSTRLHHA